MNGQRQGGDFGQTAVAERHGIADRLRQQFESRCYPELADICVEEQAGRIRLLGRVGRFYHKQLAQSIALQTAGVVSVVNEIRVD